MVHLEKPVCPRYAFLGVIVRHALLRGVILSMKHANPLEQVTFRSLVLAACLLVFFYPVMVMGMEGIEEGEVLDLERCVAIGLKNHPGMLSAAGGVKASESRVMGARSGYYPQVSASATYSRVHPSGTTSGGVSGEGSYDQYQDSVSLDQTLFDFGKTSAGVDVAGLGARASRADLADEASQVVLGVKQAFYAERQARRSLEAYSQEVVQYEQHLEQARRYYEVGVKPKIDVTNAEVALGQARLNELKARNAVRIARITLNNAMGVPDAPAYELREETSSWDYPMDLATALKRGYETRADLASARARREASERSVDVAEKGYYPVLSGNAGYAWSGQGYPLEREWSVGAVLSVPLFSGFQTRAQVAEARGNVETARGDEEQVRQAVRYDVEQAYSNLTLAREGIVLAELTMKQATENRELAQGRYASGVGSTIEVTDALVSEINAKTTYINALYGFRIAVASLEKAMGVSQ
jgi:outer membrane protein TolC